MIANTFFTGYAYKSPIVGFQRELYRAGPIVKREQSVKWGSAAAEVRFGCPAAVNHSLRFLPTDTPLDAVALPLADPKIRATLSTVSLPRNSLCMICSASDLASSGWSSPHPDIFTLLLSPVRFTLLLHGAIRGLDIKQYLGLDSAA